MVKPCAILVDVDGTLVDSNYFHTIAWYRAFRRAGLSPTLTSIHRLIGMGADQLLFELVGHGDEDLEHSWQEEFRPLRHEIVPTPGARDLLRALAELGAAIVLATSGKPEDVAALRSVIDADTWVDDVVSASEVSASKPAPDIFELALRRAGVGPESAMVIGDTVWDVRAAEACGLACVALETGGISAAELEGAGAVAVYESPRHLLSQLRASPLSLVLSR